MSSFNVTGLDKLEAALLGLDQKIARKYMREAGKEAMRPVLETMKAGAGEDLGVMKNAIKMRATTAKGRSHDSANRVMGVRVGVFTKRGTGESRRNNAALAQEFGTSKQKAVPFMRPALKTHHESVIQTVSASLKRAIESG